MAPTAAPTAGPVFPTALLPVAVAPAAITGPGIAATAADLAMIRTDLMGELEAISQYEAHAARATNPQVRELLLHSARDEKEHVAELTRLINQLDPQQLQEFRRV